MLKKLLLLLLSVFALAVTIFVVLVAWPLESAPLVGKKGAFAIEHANIVDVRTGNIQHDSMLLIEDGVIVNILPSSSTNPPTRFNRISAKGKYVIPGLWDMHTHSYKTSPQIHHPLYLAHGVTSVRDMSGCMDQPDSYWACIEDREKWTEEALNGDRVSPRYVLQSSYQTNGGNEVPSDYPAFFKLENAEHAEALAAFYQSEGADFIKPYSELSVEQYQYLAKAALAHDLYLAGHKPIKISLTQAIASRQRSIEHGRLFLFECFKGIQDFRNLDDPIAYYNTEFKWRLVTEQDPQKCAALMDQMARSGIWWVPTLTTLRMSAMAGDAEFRNDPRLEEIPYVIKELIWFPDANRAKERGYLASGEYVPKALFELASRQVALAHEAGVKILVGTDVSDTYVFTGSSLHQELAMFVDAGITPLKALQAATLSAAIFSGVEDELGSIEVGKQADLLLLDENPLDEIRNTELIFAVVHNGTFYDRDALDELQQFAQEQAGSVHVNVRLVWDMLSSPLMRRQLAD